MAEDARSSGARPAAGGLDKPALRAISGQAEDQQATATDRAMIEATTAALELFAAKWKVDLLYLLAAGVHRHGRLHAHLLVSKKVLSDALRSLQRDGLVHRRVFDERPVRVEYSLTPLGRSLTAPLFALYEWSERHYDEVLAARADHDDSDACDARISELPRFKASFQVRVDRWAA
jgi:DNA-binding HxlR family transcriptional regulator